MHLKALLYQQPQKLSIQPIALLSQPRKRPSPQLVVSNLNTSLRSRQLTSIAGNGTGDEVASKVLAILLAKPASVSPVIATIVSAPISKSSAALISTIQPTTSPTGPINSSSTSLALSEKTSASVSTSHDHGAVTALKSTVSASFNTQVPGYGSLTQASATPSISVTANNTGNGTTITSLPAGFSTFTASNPLWTSDTSTKINGTIFPVWYVGHHKGIVLAGLGGKPDDPVRPGCSGLFKSFFGCNTWIKFPPLGIFRINSDGVPVPQDKPSDPGEPGDPGTDENPDDPENENDTAQPTVHKHEKTDSHDSSMSSQSNPQTLTSTGTSSFKPFTQTKSSAWHSSTETTASTGSIQSTLNTASRSNLSRSSTASTASATATSTNYIIQLKPAISATQLEDIINDVKAQMTSTYTISLGSRPNDTVICAKLSPSSFAQFNADSRVSTHRLLHSQLVFSLRMFNKSSFSSGLCGSCRSEGHPRTGSYYIASS